LPVAELAVGGVPAWVVWEAVIVRKALHAPSCQIITYAGEHGSVIVDKDP